MGARGLAPWGSSAQENREELIVSDGVASQLN